MSLLTKPKHPAYHLRPNKAVDRAIFLEMLHAFESKSSLSRYTYIGLGGPFLEDFRLIAQAFPKMKMISIEEDEEIYKRQKFHQCARNIKLINSTLEDFLSSEFPTDHPTISWVDYTSFEKASLLEISTIARTTVPLSMLRVTVRAASPLYKEMKLQFMRPEQMPAVKAAEFKQFVKKYRQRFNVQDVAYDDSLFTWNNFTEQNYPKLISNLLFSVITAACSSPKTYLPLHSVMYSDGTIMLSTTGLICLEEDKQKLTEHFKARCDFFSSDYNNVEMIDVPMLTTKERLHLEGEIPASDPNGATVISRLGYFVEENEIVNRHKIKQYEKYNRYYPYFGKLIP